MFKNIKKLILLCLLFSGLGIQAQNQELKNAEDAFAKQDYAKTMQHLSIMMNAPKQLHGDDLFYTYMLRAKSYINILHNAIKSENEELIEANQDNYILAYQDVLEAKKIVNKDELSKEVNELSNYLQRTLRLSGAGFLNNIYNNKLLNSSSRSALLDEAQKYLSAAIKLDTFDYLSHDFYGQVLMLKRDREGALKHFKKSITHFKVLDIEAFPDFGHFKIYANIAILYMQNKEVDAAIEILDDGKSKLKSLKSKSKLKNDLVETEFLRIYQSLVDVEMDIYLNTPNKRVAALTKFETAVKENPSDYSLRIAYASLLDQDQQTKRAIAVYEEAIELNKKGFLAYYNVGVLYLNEGIKLQTEANAIADEIEKKALNEVAKNNLNLALPHLRMANDADPKDISTLEALVLLTARLGMEEEYKFYRNQKKNLEK